MEPTGALDWWQHGVLSEGSDLDLRYCCICKGDQSSGELPQSHDGRELKLKPTLFINVISLFE